MIRLLQESDLPSALALSQAAGWNQCEPDWMRLFRLSHCLGVETEEGTLASSISVTLYEPDLAWIGMVLTLPEHRGKGHASRLLEAALDFAGANRCVKLDATELGAPVYRKFGFEDECVVERWRGGAAPNRPAIDDAPEAIDSAFDREAFGADRLRLLESFPHASFDVDAHAFRRPGRDLSQFGPLVARTEEAAERLARWGASHGPTFWDLFPGNARAAQIAHRLGFTPARRLLRMSHKGKDIAQDPSLVYALGGFEWG